MTVITDIDIEISVRISVDLETLSWVAGGLAAFNAPFRAGGKSVGAAAAWALEYTEPLNTWMSQVVGDEQRVAGFAHDWRSVARDLRRVEADLAASDRRLEELEGKTARALRKRYDEIRGEAQACGNWTGAAAAALEAASTIVDSLHDAIVGAVREVTALAVDLLSFSWNLNPLDRFEKLRDLADDVWRFVRVIEQLLDRMFTAFVQLIRLVHQLLPLIGEAIQRLRAMLAYLVDAAGAPAGIVLGSLLGGPVGGAIGLLLGDALAGAASDLLKDDPRVGELYPEDLRPEQRFFYDQASGVTEIRSMADIVAQNGYTDGMGGSDRTVIDIKKVRNANGEHWIVSLPSTQDWNALRGMFGGDFMDTLKDYPASNDLDTNIALMLMDNPHLATTYERGVLQAMSDAGVKPGDDVVYTGFSQGGIMAANLAADRSLPYNVVGVVTNGSPVDTFWIPADVPSVSFAHQGDVVHQLDGSPLTLADELKNAALGDRRYVLPDPPPGTSSYAADHGFTEPSVQGKAPEDLSAHSTASYHYSVSNLEAANPGLFDNMSHLYGTVVDHQVHSFSE